MALSLTQLQAATDDLYLNQPVDIYFEENVMLWKLMGKGGMENNYTTAGDVVDGGYKIRAFLEYGASNSGSYGATTTINQAGTDIINAARFTWAGYYASNQINLNERRANSGAAAVVDLTLAKVQNIQKTIRNTMGAAIYASAADADAFIGLGNLFDTTTATTYGDIAEDDMAEWAAVADTTSEAISYAVMQSIFRDASIGQTKSKKPNLCVTTEVLKDGYERTLQTQQRFADQALVEAGFDNIMHKGAPVVADGNQTSGYLDAVNLNFLKIKTHKDFNFTKPVWEYDKTQPDNFVANTRWSGQLICTNRKAHCRHTNLTEPT